MTGIICLRAALIGCWHFVMKPQWIYSELIPCSDTDSGGSTEPGLDQWDDHTQTNAALNLLNITCRT